MGSKASKFLPPIMDYNSLKQKIEEKKRDLYLNGKPRPPRKRKRDIYDPAKYENLNECIENTPDNLLNTDTRELVKYLTKACIDDLAKAHALFYWMASRSLFATFQPDAKKYSPIWYMNKIFTGHTNFAHFFYILCWHADIPCVIIGGITKNSAYKIGFPVVAADMAAQWNAVYVEDDWRLANIQWACIYANEPNDWERAVIVTKEEFSSENDRLDRSNIPSIPKKPKRKYEYFHRVNDYYFLTDPDELIWTHFPHKKQWQLLNNTIPLDEFLSHFYVREQFYLLDMSLTEKSHTDCVLLVDENREVRIEFALPPNCNSTYRFRYTLSHHWSSSWQPVKQQSLLRQGRYIVKDDRFSLTLHLTSEGTYKLDIFGSKQENCDFYLICSYIVKCSHTEEGPALPLKFFLGYGPGVKPQVKTIKTKDGRIKLPFPIDRNYNIMHELRNHKDTMLDGCSLLRMIDDVDDNDDDECCSLVTMIIELRLPEPGEYSLKVYGKKTDEPGKNLCNYRIIYNANEETSPMLEGSTIKDSLVPQQNRIAVLSHPGSFIQTNLETLNIIFRSEYQLSCKLFSHDVSNQATTKTSVLRDMATKECQINVTIPICGDYTLKIFAKFGEEVLGEGIGRVYELHSYRIRKVDSDHFRIRGFRLTATYIAGTFETRQSIIYISQAAITNETLLILQYQKSSLSSNLVKVIDEDDGWNIEATLPLIGDYLLSLLKKDTATGLIGNVTRYLLRRKQGIEIKGVANKNDPQQQKPKKESKKEESEVNRIKEEVIVRETASFTESQIPTKISATTKTEDSNTEGKKSVLKTELEPIQRNTKPILKEDIMIKEVERPETEFKLPKIDHNNVNIISCVNKEVQKKPIEFLEKENITANQAKDYSTSIVDIKAVVGDDNRKSVESIKSDTPSKISGPDKKKNANKDKTPEEKLSNPTTGKLAAISGTQTAEPKKNEISEDSLLRELEYAISKRNIERLKLAINRAEKHVTSDILGKAKKLLDVLQAKKDLVQAYSYQEKELLGKALEEARRVNYDNELDQVIAVAEKMYKRLCGLDDIRSTIGSFNSRAVSEIKSYGNPPKGVTVVMKAIFLILNEPEDELKDWKQIRSLMRSTNKPFLRRILHCRPRCLSCDSVELAEASLGQLNAGDISCVSEMAKVLFAWVKLMIEEVKNQQLNIDLENLEK